MGTVLAIVNQKGGVGKTTTAVNLSTYLANKGKRVLVIDFDPQGNASSGFGVDRNKVEKDIYGVLIGSIDIQSSLYETGIHNLAIIPSTNDLVGAEVELAHLDKREQKLKDKINAIKEKYDFVLIDCPPSLGILTVNALCASDKVIIPVQCEYYALEGLGNLVKTLKLIKKNMNPSLEIAGILMTMYDSRTMLNNQVIVDAKKFFGDKVFETVIPRSVRLSEAPSHGLPIMLYEPESKGAIAYNNLAREVLKFA